MVTESLEIKAIRKYLTDSGVNHVVTFTNTGKHVANSYHFREGTLGLGLAVDIGLNPAQPNSPALRAIYDALHAQKSQLAELIYTGSGLTTNIKNGREVPIYDHAPDASNHVHVAVEKGTFLAWSKPNLPSSQIGELDMQLAPSAVTGFLSALDGGAQAKAGTGWELTADGGIRAINGAPFWGSVPGLKPAQQDHGPFTGLTPNEDGTVGYTIVSATGNRFEFGPGKNGF